ncbi:hypothetical protein ES703_66605 [subsurface metagenome]
MIESTTASIISTFASTRATSISMEEMLRILYIVPANIVSLKPVPWRVIAPVPLLKDADPLSSPLALPLRMRIDFSGMPLGEIKALSIRLVSTRVEPSPAPSPVVMPEYAVSVLISASLERACPLLVIILSSLKRRPCLLLARW